MIYKPRLDRIDRIGTGILMLFVLCYLREDTFLINGLNAKHRIRYLRTLFL